MHRVSASAHSSFARCLVRSLSVVVLCASATVHAGTDGLAISGTPATSVTMGQSYSFTPTVADPSRRTLHYSVLNKPSWATFNTATGHLAGTPAAANIGTQYSIRISVTDGVTTVNLPSFALTVHASTAAKPAISGSPPTSAGVGATYSFTPRVSNPAKLALHFGIWNKPAWATFDPSTGHLAGTPHLANVGTQYGVRIYVADTSGADTAFLPGFAITVHPPAADKPSIAGSPATSINVGQSYSFTPTVSNPGKLALHFGIWNKPAWATFSASTGHLGGTPGAANVGTQYSIRIFVGDGVDTVFLPGFAIKVNPTTNTVDKPVISGTPATNATAGSTYKFQPAARDPAGKTLSFSVQNKPSWATFSISSGLLDGTPTNSQTGTYSNIVISASNGQYSSALPAFAVTVKAPTTATTGAATINWVPPRANTNGSALNNLAGVRIYYGTSSSNLNHMVQVAGTATNRTTIGNLAAGTWYFGGVAYTTAGVQSAMSAVVSKYIP